jgi:hypothetical protein
MLNYRTPSSTSSTIKMAVLACALNVPLPVLAQTVVLDKSETINDKRDGWLPYFFATDSLGTAVGVAGGFGGVIQPQSSVFGTVFLTSNDSALLSGAINNIRLGNSRLFTDSFLLVDHFTDQRFYADIDNDPSQVKAGSNDSDEEDFISGISDEITFQQTLRYSLPIGSNAVDPLTIYTLDQGLLQSAPSGGKEWNPLTSGRTTLASRFFYTYRDLSEYDGNEDQLESQTNGLDFWLEYNNTDFPRNPSYGSRQQAKLTRDFGWFDSSNSWTNLELDMAKYVDLGTSSWFKQKVLALNFWTSNTPSWEANPNNSQEVANRPPPGYGSELGGFDRMRAYPNGRFRDKSAVYYAAEFRFTPQFQKMRDWPVIKYFEVDWFQIVPFVEAGRVSEEYDGDLFTKDLKFDAGVGLRAMAFRTVFRLDFAVSEEGAAIQAMISQPFSRPGN